MGMASSPNKCYWILIERMLDTCFQQMVKGSMHFLVYHPDTPPHKATGNKAMTSVRYQLHGRLSLGLAQVKEQNLNKCLSQQPRVYIIFHQHLFQQKQGSTCHLSTPPSWWLHQSVQIIGLLALKRSTQSLLSMHMFLFIFLAH